jgi:hypothetical protein
VEPNQMNARPEFLDIAAVDPPGTSICRAVPPSRLAQLSGVERLLLWAVRRWIAGLSGHDYAQWEQVSQCLESQLGYAEGHTATAGLARAIQAICCHARGRFDFGPACCGQVSADEALLLALIAAEQHEDPAAPLLASRLVGDDGCAMLGDGAQDIAGAFLRCGHRLPDRRPRQ